MAECEPGRGLESLVEPWLFGHVVSGLLGARRKGLSDLLCGLSTDTWHFHEGGHGSFGDARRRTKVLEQCASTGRAHTRNGLENALEGLTPAAFPLKGDGM